MFELTKCRDCQRWVVARRAFLLQWTTANWRPMPTATAAGAGAAAATRKRRRQPPMPIRPTVTLTSPGPMHHSNDPMLSLFVSLQQVHILYLFYIIIWFHIIMFYCFKKSPFFVPISGFKVKIWLKIGFFKLRFSRGFLSFQGQLLS